MTAAKRARKKRASARQPMLPAEGPEEMLERISRKLTAKGARAERVIKEALGRYQDEIKAPIVQALMTLDAWLGDESEDA